jgi:hypothetical protein
MKFEMGDFFNVAALLGVMTSIIIMEGVYWVIGVKQTWGNRVGVLVFGYILGIVLIKILNERMKRRIERREEP